MKHNNIARSAVFAIFAALSLGPVHAGSIDGSLNFGGEAVAIPGPSLANAVGLSFTSGFLVTDATGTFATNGIGFGDTGMIADFFFNPFGPDPVSLIQILFDTEDSTGGAPGKFVFSLETIEVVDQSDMFLVLAGCGTLSGTGLDPTQYAMSMSVDGVGSLYAFSGTLAPKVVPVPGALILMLSALAALGVRRRN